MVEVINARIARRGIGVKELSRRIDMNYELLRRSLLGERKLQAFEFVCLCKELELDLDDFADVETS